MRTTTIRWTAGLGAALLAVFAFHTLATVRGELLEDRTLNYEIEIPHGWSRLPKAPSWEDYGIVVGAERALDSLKSGKSANGEGGQVHLAITDAPEGKSLDDLAADASVRGFLLNRFSRKASAWPDVKVAPQTYDDGLEVRILSAEGKAPNLKGHPGPVRSVMVLAIAKKKLYKLRMYAWCTEFDAEGLKGDLDVIEMNFVIPDLKEASSDSDAPRPPDADDEDESKIEGDEGEEVVFKDEKVGWKIVKPVGIKSRDDYDKETYADVVVWFEDNDNVGSYQILFYVIPRGRQNSGVSVPDMNLKEWGLNNWWASFTKEHVDGPIVTFKWPRKTKSWITLPDYEKPKTVASEPRKRPKEANASALIKKLKAVEKVKNQKLGKEKTIEAYRGVLSGNRARYGKEYVHRFVWGTARLTCMISVSLTRDAPMKWAEKISKLLESIEMTGRSR